MELWDYVRILGDQFHLMEQRKFFEDNKMEELMLSSRGLMNMQMRFHIFPCSHNHQAFIK